MADALDFALAGLPPDTRLADLIAMQAKPSAPPAAIQLQPPKRVVRDVMTPEQQAAVSQPDPAAPIAPTALPQVKPSSYVDQYRQMMSSQVPGRPMSSYGVEPTFNTPERDQATKTLGTPAPKQSEYHPGFWRTLLSSVAGGMMAYGHNPNAGIVMDRGINAPFYSSVSDWQRSQDQAKDVLSEQDKQYGTQAANWRNFLTLQQREDNLDRQRERDADRAEYEGRIASVREEANKLKEQAFGQEKPSDKTVTVGNKVMQFNPKTGKYDITVGPRPPREFASEDGNRRGTPGQFAHAAQVKESNLAAIEREYRSGKGRFADLDMESPEGKQEAADRLQNLKQEAQNAFEEKVMSLGGDVDHYDYASQNGKGGGKKTKPQVAPQAQPQSQSAPAEVERKLVGPDGKPLTAVVRNGRWVNKATGNPL